jgi:hypothetical protein
MSVGGGAPRRDQSSQIYYLKKFDKSMRVCMKNGRKMSVLDDLIKIT